MAKIYNIAILLMAAGESRRLGQSKQQIERQQVPLLVRQSELALAINDSSIATEVYCILGYGAENLRSLLPSSIHVIVHRNWQRGLSSSIAKGIEVLDNDIDAALIFFVDQWQLTTVDLRKLIGQWLYNSSKILIANDQIKGNQALGPPVIFPREYFPDLIQLKGDNGAKVIIEKNRSEVVSVLIPSAFVDLDTPEQLKRVEKTQAWPTI